MARKTVSVLALVALAGATIGGCGSDNPAAPFTDPPAPDPEPAVKPGLKVRAVQVDGGGTITDGIGFWIYDAARYESGDRNQITYSSNSEPFFELPPGMYVVRATHGAAENTVPIALPKDKFVDLEIVIGSGDLQVTSVLKEGGEPVARDLGNWVYKADPGADGKRERVTYSSNASPKFALPSGRYYVWVDHGDAGAGVRVMNALKLCALAENLGAVETLVTHMGMELDWLMRVLDENRCSGNL